MLVVMTVRTILKVPLEKAAPPCTFDVPAPLVTRVRVEPTSCDQGRRKNDDFTLSATQRRSNLTTMYFASRPSRNFVLPSTFLLPTPVALPLRFNCCLIVSGLRTRLIFVGAQVRQKYRVFRVQADKNSYFFFCT